MVSSMETSMVAVDEVGMESSGLRVKEAVWPGTTQRTLGKRRPFVARKALV